MPVNFEWDRDLEEWDWSTVTGGIDMLEVPSEEFWKKFEELPDLGDNLETLFAEASDLGGTINNDNAFLTKHDCMWAGVCYSKDHKEQATSISQPQLKQEPPDDYEPVISSSTHNQNAVVVDILPQARERKRTVTIQKNTSILRTNRMSDAFMRPDTPQSMGSESEEEPVSARAVVPAYQVTGQVRRKCLPPVHVDHDYQTKMVRTNTSVVRTEELGVQTPSDSEEEEQEGDEEEDEEEVEEEQEVEEEEIEDEEEEEEEEEEEVEEEEEEEEEDDDDEDEEIDVVNLKPIKANRFCSPQSSRTPSRGATVYNGYGYSSPRSHQGLPTNPTTQVRHQLQETMADSLLTASRAVSRRLQGAVKRKRCSSFRSPSAQGTQGPGRGRRRVPPAKKSKYSSPSSSPSSSSTHYLVDTEKRSLHNNMERMRRIDLRNAFEDLRLLVPSISDSIKAPKVTILKDATHFVKELNLKDRNLAVQRDALRNEQEKLRRTLSQLRRILAFKNIVN